MADLPSSDQGSDCRGDVPPEGSPGSSQVPPTATEGAVPAAVPPVMPPIDASPEVPEQPVTRLPVSFQPAEPGWWQATDGFWYPPEAMPSAPNPATGISSPGEGSQNVVVHVNQVAPQTPVGPPKSKMTAFLLAFFFGTLGVHRFYLGLGGSGAVMLILTLTVIGWPISLIWAVIDCILILTGGLRDRDGRQLA